MVCTRCGSTFKGDLTLCPACGVEREAEPTPPKPEPRYKRRYAKWQEESARPWLVTVLGLYQLLVGLLLVLSWFAVGSGGVAIVDGLGTSWAMLLLLLPGALYLLVGVGFLTRTNMAYRGAVGLAVVGAIVATVAGVVQLLGALGEVPAVALLVTFVGVLLSILGFVLVILVMGTTEVRDWFDSA